MIAWCELCPINFKNDLFLGIIKVSNYSRKIAFTEQWWQSGLACQSIASSHARGWGFKTCSFSNAYNETLFLSGQAVSRMCMPRCKFLFAHEHKLRLSIFELSQLPRRVYISFMCGPAFLKTYCLCMRRIRIHMCQPSKSVHVWMWYMAIYCYVKSGDLAWTHI